MEFGHGGETMRKLLFQLDTDLMPSVFDTVVAYDGGADHVTPYGGVTPANVGALVDGAIFTRSPRDKKYTALFIGGSDMAAGQALLAAVREKFFAKFRVSVMLDSNGANTTAAAAVVSLARSGALSGKRAVVLAGTGPAGQRAAVMLSREGARVTLTARTLERAEAACRSIRDRFGLEVTPLRASSNDARGAALNGAQIVVAAGAGGVQLLAASHWQTNSSIEMLLDCNATPPLGIEGIEPMDKAAQRYGKLVFGAIGFGPFKLQVHRACIARLFDSPDQVVDADAILSLAKTMA